jgi:hypothetical protein
VLKAGRWIVVRMSQTDSAIMDDGTDADWLSARLDGPRQVEYRYQCPHPHNTYLYHIEHI